jgi:hypothetical protein
MKRLTPFLESGLEGEALTKAIVRIEGRKD